MTDRSVSGSESARENPDRQRYPGARIAVFLREPLPGATKTRLIPALGAAGALALYEAMAERTIRLIQREALAGLSLWVTSNPAHEWFLSNCNKKEIYVQEGSDLGLRMAHCAATLLAQDGVDGVLIVGSDCPALDGAYLSQALAALESGADVVIGPASDGGYVLIGLRAPVADLFRDVDWGTSRVLAQTMAHAQELALRVELLPELWDVDTEADLTRLDSLQPPLAWHRLEDSGS